MTDNPAIGTANPMPIHGSGCGIRPTEEALAVGYAVDFSAAAKLLHTHQNPATDSTSSPDTLQD